MLSNHVITHYLTCSIKKCTLSCQFIRYYKVKHIDINKTPELSLKNYIPESVLQWDYELNGDLKPETIPYNLDKYVWWKCPNGPDHVWSSLCRKRVDKDNKRLLPCPFCSNKRVSVTNSLLTKYPELASEFDMISNHGLQSNEVIYTSKKPYYWKCKYNHIYKMTIQKRLQLLEEGKQSCPLCKSPSLKDQRLYDVYPMYFDESYNWLNCPSLSPPSMNEISEEEYKSIPSEAFSKVCFEDLYVGEKSTNPTKSQPTVFDSQNSKSQHELSLVDDSIKRSISHHILEYQLWKETLRYNDKRIIWWVCSSNPNHIWRESVSSRVKNECPFCKSLAKNHV